MTNKGQMQHGGAPRRRGRYDAPGDPPLVVPAIRLEVPFALDAALAQRLAKREVNPKEAFTVRDETGAYFRASLRELADDGGLAVPYERMARSPESVVEITLACAVLARQRMIFVIQKATELGVARIVPLFSRHSVPEEGLEHEKAHAWPGQAIRAARQCRRSSLPEIFPPTQLDAFLASPAAGADLAVFLDDRSEVIETPAGRPRSVVLIAGPEGGFSDSERESLRAKAIPWVLGGRVLRAETAVVAGLVAVHLAWGDFRP
jgi:16S rRNA (uracil1498-N3)-methyltransferase